MPYPPPENFDESDVAERPGFLSRLLGGAVNAPYNIATDVANTPASLGLSSEKMESMAPFDIPPAQDWTDVVADIPGALLRAVPEYLGGRGIAKKFLPKTLSPIIKEAVTEGVGFAAPSSSDASEAATQGGIGAGFGAASALMPGKAKFLLSAGVGGATYLAEKAHGASDLQAAGMGTVNALLPAFSRGARPITRSSDPLLLNNGPSNLLEDVQSTRPINGTGGPVPYGGELVESTTRAMPIEGTQQFEPAGGRFTRNDLPIQEGQFADIPNPQLVNRPAQLMLPQGNGEGMLIAQPRFSPNEANTIATLQSKAQAPQVSAPRVQMSTVLHPENQTMVNAAAKKLGINFEQIFPTEQGARIGFKFPENAGHEAAGASFDVPAGTTFKDLKNTIKQKIEQFKVAGVADQLQLTFNGINPENGNWTLTTKGPREMTFEVPKNSTPSTIKAKRAEMEAKHKNRMTPEEAKEKLRQLRESPTQKKSELEVATLQKGVGAEPQSAASLETNPASPFEIALPNDLKIGDKTVFGFEGDRIVGTIQPSVEKGLVRVVERNGTAHDVRPSELKRIEEFSDVPQEVETPILEKEQKSSIKLSEGTMRKSNFGEAGFASPETLSLLARYGVAPIIGGAVGYAEDDQHRWGSAVAGAVAGGLAGYMGKKAFELLKAGHPSIGTAKTAADKFSAIKKAVGEDSRSFAKGLFADEKMARKAASRWGWSSEYDRLARWIQKNVTTNLDQTRLREKAFGMVEDLSEMVRASVVNLSKIPGIDAYKPLLNDYFEGKITHAQFASKAPKEIVDLAATARDSTSSLQNIIVQGLGGGKLSTKIKDSVGKYLTTTYRIFHDSKYKPTDAQITAAARSMQKQFGGTIETRLTDIHEYLHEIYASRGMFAGKSGGETLSTIMQRSQEISPEFKEMLGIYKDPLERMGFTGIKLVNGARSAEFFNEVAKGSKENGLKFAYSEPEWERQIATLQHQASYGFTPEARAAARLKLEEVQGYVRNRRGNDQGRLSGMFVDVRMRDQLANYDSAKQLYTNPFVRGLMETTNAIKYGQVILSPLQFVRQVYQMPVLGLMAKTFPADWSKAFKTLVTDKSAAGVAERQRLKRLGVLSGDPVGGMLRRDMRAMIDGTIDALLNDKLKAGLHNWEEIWRTPDLIIRTSAFQRKEAELLTKGLSAEDAANQALNHMNRYTMNYGAVPPIVVKGRQLPFINQYLSFSYEMLRITKNLAQDALKGDPYAIGVMTTLTTLPFLIQQMSESQLSDKDKDEWNKVKNLGPAYNRHNFRFVQRREANGDFRYIDFTPLVLQAPWLISFKAAMAGDSASMNAANPVFGWENTPMLNVAATLVTGRNRHSGEQLYGAADYIDSIRKDVAPILLGTELDRVKNALTTNSEGGVGIVNKRTGQTNTISDVLQTYLTSMRPYTLKPAYVKMQATNEARDRIRQQQIFARRVFQSNASNEVKLQAKQQYETAVEHILLDYREKLGIQEIQPATVTP